MSKAKAKKSAPKKSATIKSASKKPAAKKPAVKKAAVKKPTSKKATAKKVAPKKAAAKKAAAQKPATKKSAAKKTPIASSAKSKVKAEVASKVTKIGPVAALKNVANLFSPLDDRILVSQAKESNRTAGGLYIPDSVAGEDRPRQGKVVAVGPGHRNKKGRLRPLDVKIGDQVMFNQFSGSELKIADLELVCLREEEIIAVID
jgi:chaperonin GroES